ncbi:uncharacterized protein [Dysidea avara]|uniref:uncharacterized protein isoform X3 n=1 Tax=Dysidea avara TaxID=196820 RepID=UPI003326270F
MKFVWFVIILICGVTYCSGQNCTDTVNVQQIGENEYNDEGVAIAPRLNFTCNGRITNIRVRILQDDRGTDTYPYIQVWRPSLSASMTYSKIDEIQVQESQVHLVLIDGEGLRVADISLAGNNRTIVQSGDAVGFYHQSNSKYQVRTSTGMIDGYVLYFFNGSPTSLDLSNADNRYIGRQPLIQFTVDIQCYTPSNGAIISCSSGMVEVVNENDICNFTCNTGYVVNGSDTRTCQSDGSWSGSDSICIKVTCPSLTDPNNGTITCSFGDDGVPSYEDTCSFTCNTGYELTGSDTRTCQSDESWNGTEIMCRRVHCSNLTDPNNKTITCLLGDDGVPSYEDTCNFTCNTGYELTGSDTRTCQSNGNWSGNETNCSRVSCYLLTNFTNETITCSLGGDGVPSYEDTCSFTCNTGYELTDSDTRTCQSDGNWSGSDDVCRRVSVIPSPSASGESTGKSSGGSSGAVIGGIIGGVAMALVIIVVLVVVIVWIRRSQSSKGKLADSNESIHDANVSNSKPSGIPGSTASFDNVMYQAPAVTSESTKLDYENKEVIVAHLESMLNTALSDTDTDGTYELLNRCDASTSSIEVYKIAPDELSKSMEMEQQIYDTPCKKVDCGPVYCQPSDDEKKIYEEFEGKRFRKLFHKEIKICEELGTGEFGAVSRAIWKLTKQKKVEVAVKTLNANVSTKDRVRFLQEAAIMCQFDHENVVKLHGVVTDEPVMIVLEYVPNGDLRSVLLQLKQSSEATAHVKIPLLLLKFCKEIAAGMAYLNGKQFIHRDLAARNILVSQTFSCKIADFGMSRNLLDENYYITSGGKIPVKWTAPEALNYRKYSVQSDVWSYGCVLYEIWGLGCKPFEWLENLEALQKVDAGYRLPPPPGCPRAIYRVMIRCWDPEPKSRPQFQQITQLLASNHSYLLGWSDEDREIAGEDAAKLGASLESANNLYYDLQTTYRHNV